MALTALPSYLAEKPPPATVLQALITIGQTDPTEVLPLLQPTAFHALLDLPPPAQAAPHVTHRYHLLFKHDGLSSTRCWRGYVDTILTTWLQIVYPLIGSAGFTMTLTLSPHLVRQDPTAVDDTSIAGGGLRRYVYKTYPRPNKFKRFELWLTSDCLAFDVDLDQHFDGEHLSTYLQQLREHHITIQHLESYLAETVPVVLLANSFARDRDDIIVSEI